MTSYPYPGSSASLMQPGSGGCSRAATCAARLSWRRRLIFSTSSTHLDGFVSAHRKPRAHTRSAVLHRITTLQKYPWIHGYFVASFPHFNGTAVLHTSVSVNRRNNEARAMWALASLFSRCMLSCVCVCVCVCVSVARRYCINKKLCYYRGTARRACP